MKKSKFNKNKRDGRRAESKSYEEAPPLFNIPGFLDNAANSMIPVVFDATIKLT